MLRFQIIIIVCYILGFNVLGQDSIKKESLIVNFTYGGDYKQYTTVKLDLERDMIRYHLSSKTTIDFYHQFSIFQSKNFEKSVNYAIYPSFGLNFTSKTGLFCSFQTGVGFYSSFLYSSTFSQYKRKISYHKVRAGYGLYTSLQYIFGYDFSRINSNKIPFAIAFTINSQGLNQQSSRLIPTIPSIIYGVQLTYHPKDFHRKKINEN